MTHVRMFHTDICFCGRPAAMMARNRVDIAWGSACDERHLQQMPRGDRRDPRRGAGSRRGLMNYRLIVRPVDSFGYVNVQALVVRAGDWVVCGVFRLLSSEWPSFKALCNANGIEVEIEQPVPPAPAEVSAT